MDEAWVGGARVSKKWDSMSLKVLQIRFHEWESSEWARQNLLSSMRIGYQFSRVELGGPAS